MIENPAFFAQVSEVRTGRRAVSGLERSANEPIATNNAGFNDILDAVNPLQHIPVVGAAYRAATGDGISQISSIIGGAIFGGPIGFLGSLFNTLLGEVGFGSPAASTHARGFADNGHDITKPSQKLGLSFNA